MCDIVLRPKTYILVVCRRRLHCPRVSNHPDGHVGDIHHGQCEHKENDLPVADVHALSHLGEDSVDAPRLAKKSAEHQREAGDDENAANLAVRLNVGGISFVEEDTRVQYRTAQ